MTGAARWVRWDLVDRGGHAAKVPMTVGGRFASVNRPGTWTTYQAATASRVGRGAGFVLGEGVGCLDLDNALLGGTLTAWAADVLAGVREPVLFAELSQSRRGVHVFIRAPESPAAVRRFDGGGRVERYTRGRFIALTGVPFTLP